MFVMTRRVKAVFIWLVGENRSIEYSKENYWKFGIMGLRIGKTKQGLIVYHNGQYDFYNWSTIAQFQWHDK